MKATLCQAPHILNFLVPGTSVSGLGLPGGNRRTVLPADVMFGLHGVFINFLIKCIQVKHVLSDLP